MERFLDYYRPEECVLDITVDKNKKYIGGKVGYMGEAKAETIKLHAVGLKIKEVLIDDEKWDFSHENGVLTLSEVPRRRVKVEVVYDGSLNENMQGAYISTYKYKNREEMIVATQFESHYAREAFPCIDEPEAKMSVGLILTVPGRDDLVVSNMPAMDYEIFEEEGQEMVTTYFHPSPPMSTYLLAFVIGRFREVTGYTKDDVMVTTWAPLNQKRSSVVFANEVAIKALEFYGEEFGVRYPFVKLTQVAIPDFEAGAMENWGLVTYRESMLIAGPNASMETRKDVALTVAHELAHQWFGDLVTMKWWDDLWLNESFASVMEYFAVDALYPEFKIWERFYTGDAVAALRRDCLSGVQAVHQEVESPEEIATLFDPAIVYAKGARLLLMLIRLMGWEEFCEGCEEYFREFGLRNAVGDDLWEVMSRHAEFDVGELMHAFIDRPGYPVITEGEQRRFLVDGEMRESDWPLPEVLEDMSGHYVLNLSEDEFEERLARFEELGLEEKLRLLIDRSLLAKTKLVESGSLVPLVWKFREEESAAVWNILTSIVAGLKIFFPRGSKEEDEFKDWVAELVRPGLEKVGRVTREGDDENTLRLRADLVALEFYAETNRGKPGQMSGVKELSKYYRKEVGEIDREMRGSVLDAKIYLEPEKFEEFLEMYGREVNPEIKMDLLFAMTLVREGEAAEKALGLLGDYETVKPQDQFYLYIYLYRNPALAERAFEWLRGHFEEVRKMAGDKSLENYPRYMAGSVRSAEERDAFMEFFGPMREDPALARAIEVAENEMRAQLELIESDREGVKKAIKKRS